MFPVYVELLLWFCDFVFFFREIYNVLTLSHCFTFFYILAVPKTRESGTEMNREGVHKMNRHTKCKKKSTEMDFFLFFGQLQ